MASTPLFWLIALLLVAATVGALVWPLLRARAPRFDEPDDAATTDVYRDHKRQLDAELAAGVVTQSEHAAGVDELASRLGAELDASASPGSQRASTRASYVAALVLAAMLPVTALVLYAAFGNPAAMRVVATAEQRPPMSEEQIVAMVESLAMRMKEHPEDPKGWRLLARAYSAMGRYDDAVAAFTKAAGRGPQDASLLADWADALAMQRQSLQGEPSRLAARALALDPDHTKALALAASAALERNDYDLAITHWRKLQAQFPAGSDEASDLGAMIAEADAAKSGASTVPSTSNARPGTAGAGAPPADSGAAAAGAPSIPAAASAPSIPAAAGTPSIAAAAEATAVTGTVSLDPKLRERVAANDTLYIFARAADGPRMPLAVVRTTAGEWPREFRLDDTMAMTQANRLSAAGEVVVEARVSKTGSAMPAPGDLQGKSVSVKPGARRVSVVIDDVVR